MLALTILGNNSAIPAFGRFPTSQYLQTEDTAYLIDCGEGTQQRLLQYRLKRSKIGRIFISHLHGDHYFGLIGLITSMSLTGRLTDLHLFGPPLLIDIIRLQLSAGSSKLSYELYFHPLGEDGEISNDNKISVESFRVRHSIDCWGFKFTEIKNLRHIDPVRAASYEIPIDFYPALQHGKDYVNAKGTVIPNAEVTKPHAKPKSFAFCADTIFTDLFIDKIRGVDLLYHETTFLHEFADKAAMRFHSTTLQAAEIANKAQVKKLLIGHFSSRYEEVEQFVEEARKGFAETEIAYEGVTYNI